VPELASSFEDAWSHFQTADSVRLAEEGHLLSLGRAQMLGFLIRIEDRAVRRHAEAIVERVSGVPGVEPLPDEHWHVTVKLAGFQVIKRVNDDDILREEVSALGRQCGSIIAKQSAYEARIGLPNAFADAVFLEVHDGGATAALNAALSAHELVATYPHEGDHFLPHMSIARFNSTDGLAELKSTLAELREVDGGPSFTVSRVDFVKAWLTDDEPDIETLAGYRLAAP
jgi:2'-5' RNA ligase